MSRTLAAAAERFALHTLFRISRGVKTAADVVTVTLRDGDAFGRGEGVPYPRYGENLDSVLAAIEAVRPAIEAGACRDELLTLMPAGAARNAVDCALWDLEAQHRGESVAAILRTPQPGRLASALTVVIDAPEAMALAAARIARAPLIKVKVDASDPAAQVRAVRDAAPHARLIVDPNESWNADVAAAMRPVLVDARVALLEQPAPAGADEWLAGFDAGVPVCADESVHTTADLDRVAALYDAINIKLDKAGGLTAALALLGEARGRGLGVMTGCMICSSLSIAPALHVAARCDFADLDGPLWLAQDRAGGVRDECGLLAPPSPGLWGHP